MLKTVSLQIVLVIVVAALGSLYWGTPGARDILLGGLACAVPNVLFARLLARAGRQSSQAFVAAFLLGEFLKLALPLFCLMAIVRWLTPAHWEALLLGIITALHAPWLMALSRRRENRIHAEQGVQSDTRPGS